MLVTDFISPMKEMAAYEALWENEKASFKTLSQLFASRPGSKPSDFVSDEKIDTLYDTIKQYFSGNKLSYRPNLIINGTLDFPKRLNDAREPIELLYYSGNLDYLQTKSISIVGTRKPSPEGVRRTKQLVKQLVKDDFTIVSGLAMGVDTTAHTTAILNGGRTIAVIGTPLNTVYPKSNFDLQNYIAKEHLLISQVPFHRYSKQGINGNKLLFPERNKTMSAISLATVIIEAGETSGTLVQARAAIQQGRKLFILESCFQNPNITWPAYYEKLGAIRVKEYSDIFNELR
jgi:DNA processing protein